MPLDDLPVEIRDMKDPHKQMLARLEHERTTRNDLIAAQKKLEKKRNELMKTNDVQRVELEKLDSKVEDMCKAVEQLKSFFGDAKESTFISRESDKESRELPEPLYILYRSAAAFADGFGKGLAFVCVVFSYSLSLFIQIQPLPCPSPK